MEWQTDKAALSDYREKQGWNYDEKLFVTPDGRYGLFFYNICEVSMCCYYGTLAVFEQGNSSPLITLKNGECRTWFDYEMPYYYAPLSDCVITVYGIDRSKLGVNGMPYLLIKPQKKQFAFLPFDFTSIYYSFNEKSENLLELSEKRPDEIRRCEGLGHKCQTGRLIDLNKLNWYNISEIEKAVELCKKQNVRRAEAPTVSKASWRRLTAWFSSQRSRKGK